MPPVPLPAGGPPGPHGEGPPTTPGSTGEEGRATGPTPVVVDLDDDAYGVREITAGPPTAIPHLWNRRRYRLRTVTHLEASWRIFLTVAVLAGVIALALAAFAFFTYPSISDIQTLGADDPEFDGVKAWSDARQAWAQQFVTLAQVVLFGSIVPLLATIAGYALAERRNDAR